MAKLDELSAPIDEPDLGLGPAIRRFREEQNLSRSDLEDRAGLDPGLLDQIEGNELDPPWGVAESIAHALGIEMYDFATTVVEARRPS